jgi:UDP-N-acetylmuramoylalanine--D-glutamate ligase
MQIEKLKNKKILILGFGKEGKDTFHFLRKIFPKMTIGIADRNEKVKDKRIKNVKWHLGKDYLKSIKSYDLIFKAPGIPVHLKEIEIAFSQNKIISQTEIFLENFREKIIGITGTKGKSTTAALIFSVLKEGGFKVKLLGNIGKTLFSFLLSPNKIDFFVLELSCHQLYRQKQSPHIAVFLNIFPEHLDYYKSFQEYQRAKANICLWQKPHDILIYNFKDKTVREIVKKSLAKKIPIKNSSSILKKIGIKKIPFFANFYQENIAFAVKVGEILGIKKEKIKKAIEKFKPLPHRLEYVGKFKGIEFFNDSLSTIPQTTIAALNSFGKKVQTLILGGYDRGVNFKELAKEILKKRVKNLILFPESGKRIAKEITTLEKKENFVPKKMFVDNMKEAIKISFDVTPKNKICLLSPASPSFGIFKDYKERGNLFKRYVRYFGKKESR